MNGKRCAIEAKEMADLWVASAAEQRDFAQLR